MLADTAASRLAKVHVRFSYQMARDNTKLSDRIDRVMLCRSRMRLRPGRCWPRLLAAFARMARQRRCRPASVSGLPVPRFVSLKSDRVNVREGPNKDQDVRWVYTRAGMPVEITAEFENWRRIRDWEGAEGWVYHSLLSGKRTRRWWCRRRKDELVPLFASADVEGRRWWRGCRPACSAREELQRHLVPASPARVSTAGSGRSELWGVYPEREGRLGTSTL